MRDHLTEFDDAGACADDVRDALPLLLHGRLDTAERARVESHIATCAGCAAELALLGAGRAVLTASGPHVDVGAIAAAVRAATVPSSASDRSPAPIRGATDAPAWAMRTPTGSGPTRWRAGRAWRALAAGVVIAVGSAAAWVGLRSPSGTGEVASQSAPAAGSALLAAAQPSLGTGLDDLSDAELQAVLDAVTADEAGLPDVEPAAALPAVEVGGGR